MRSTVNMYRDKAKTDGTAMMDESDIEETDDEGESFPAIDLDGLMEEMDSLAIEEDEDEEE